MKCALRTRLAAGLAISFVMLAGLQWLLAGIAIERLVTAQLAQRLERDAENLLAALDGEAGAPLRLDDARIGSEYRQPFSGHYFRIVIDGGDDISSRSLWDHTLALPARRGSRCGCCRRVTKSAASRCAYWLPKTCRRCAPGCASGIFFMAC